MPLEHAARNRSGLDLIHPRVRVAHSGRHEAAVGKLGDPIEVAILLQKDAALPGEGRRRAAKVEIVDFDRFSFAVTRGVDAEASVRRFGQAETVHVEGVEIKRARTVGVGVSIVLQSEGIAVYQFGPSPCYRIDQIHVTGRTMTGRKHETGGADIHDVFGSDEATQIG
jgi:hypothetical protein